MDQEIRSSQVDPGVKAFQNNKLLISGNATKFVYLKTQTSERNANWVALDEESIDDLITILEYSKLLMQEEKMRKLKSQNEFYSSPQPVSIKS